MRMRTAIDAVGPCRLDSARRRRGIPQCLAPKPASPRHGCDRPQPSIAQRAARESDEPNLEAMRSDHPQDPSRKRHTEQDRPKTLNQTPLQPFSSGEREVPFRRDKVQPKLSGQFFEPRGRGVGSDWLKHGRGAQASPHDLTGALRSFDKLARCRSNSHRNTAPNRHHDCQQRDVLRKGPEHRSSTRP